MTPHRAARSLAAAALGLALFSPAAGAVDSASAVVAVAAHSARVDAPAALAPAPEVTATPSPTRAQGEDSDDRLGLTGDDGAEGPGWWLWFVVALGGGVAVALTIQRSHHGSGPSKLWQDES